MSRLGHMFAWSVNRARADWLLYVLVLCYTLGGLALMSATGTMGLAAFKPYVSKWINLFFFIFPVSAILIDSIRVVHRIDARRRLGLLNAFSPMRLAYMVSGTALLLWLFLFQGTFTSVKNAMFAWNGAFRYDRIHADIDKFLHFGIDPWRIVEPLVANDTLRWITEFNYNAIYFSLSFGTLYFVATSPRAEKVRAHYIACFVLAWIVIGNLLAGLFLSAGPAFYGHVTGDTARFAELLDYLARSEGAHAASGYQAYLWKLHEGGNSGFASGISAFPSVHVSLSVLNMFFAYEVSRRLGYAMTAYAFFIFLSSVALGWHYAIDGYASVAVVAALYFGLKRPLRSGLFRTRPAAAGTGKASAAQPSYAT